MTSSYEDFIATKGFSDPATGLSGPIDVSQKLFPFQRDIVCWALRRGRAAIFADCGMGKTAMQLEWARRVTEAKGCRALILAPLAVAQQTVREGAKFGIDVQYAREDNGAQILITNYEILSRFDPSQFGAVVLDESSILKAYDGKTRTQIIESFQSTPFRLACTATPAPNDHMELGNHAQFLGVMTREEMLAMFFAHDGGETQKWRIKGHAQQAFWRWVCSWACMIRKPSDLGYDDGAFILPTMQMHEESVGVEHSNAHRVGRLFVEEARSLSEQREARTITLPARVDRTAEIVNASTDPWIVWCELNAESEQLTAAIPDAVEIRGSDDPELKAKRMIDFSEGRIRVLVTKPSIAGFGMNWQHCAHVAFVGLSHSYEQFYQALRRCWRFGQKRSVQCHVVTSVAEGAVLSNIRRKELAAEEMAKEMVTNMRDIQREEIQGVTRDVGAYAREMREGPGWTLHLGDCVDVVRGIPTESVHYSVFSPPFASLYTYSNSDRDMGNVKTHAEFYDHFRFLVPELFRVTKPGRLLSFHCMQLPTSKARDGVIGLTDFRGLLIKSFQDAGWIYHSEVVIWKDPVTAMQRTKALGLLHKQLKKDSCMSRQGVPDYLITMRKPGDNPERVTHSNESFPVSDWQRYASPVWMDINPNDTIQYRAGREDEDERHICPLQLEVIRRALRMWSNPGDLILSPFAGIGSEGYVAIEEGRSFVGAELKRSYWEQAIKNLQSAEPHAKGRTADLFGGAA